MGTWNQVLTVATSFFEFSDMRCMAPLSRARIAGILAALSLFDLSRHRHDGICNESEATEAGTLYAPITPCPGLSRNPGE